METEEQPLWQVREYDPAKDAAMVRAWASSRGKVLELEFLPGLGIIVELDGRPVAASWMFLCGRIGIIDKLVMPPGLGMGVIPRAAEHCLNALKEIARGQGIGALMAYAPGNATQTFMKAGGHVLGTGLTHVLFQV